MNKLGTNVSSWFLHSFLHFSSCSLILIMSCEFLSAVSFIRHPEVFHFVLSHISNVFWAIWRISHHQLAAEILGSHRLGPHQKPNNSLFVFPSAVLHPSMHLVWNWQQMDIRVCISHCVAPHTANFLQICLSFLFHQWRKRRGVQGAMMLCDHNFRLGLVT